MADDKKKDKEDKKDDKEPKPSRGGTEALTQLGKVLIVGILILVAMFWLSSFFGKMKGCSSSDTRTEVFMRTFKYTHDDEVIRGLRLHKQKAFNSEVISRLNRVFHLPRKELEHHLNQSGELATDEFRAELTQAYGLRFNTWLPSWYRDGQCMIPATREELRNLVYKPHIEPEERQDFTYHIDVKIDGKGLKWRSQEFPIAGWDIAISSARDNLPVDHVIITDPGTSIQRIYLHKNPKTVPQRVEAEGSDIRKPPRRAVAQTYIYCNGKWDAIVGPWEATNTFAVALSDDADLQTQIFRISFTLRNE